MRDVPTVTSFGERGIRLRWDTMNYEELLPKLLQLKRELQKMAGAEIMNTYNELLLIFPGPIQNMQSKLDEVQEMIKSTKFEKQIKAKLYELPVCYDPSFGIDLEELCRTNKLSTEEVMRLHTEAIYTVYFIGFLPGFLYLGGLNEQLFIDRKKNPRAQIKKGAVGIAGEQTGIYPKASPGGWQIIGNCPIEFFNSKQNPPSIFHSGDRVKFHPVSLDEYKAIEEQLKAGEYNIKVSDYGH